MELSIDCNTLIQIPIPIRRLKGITISKEYLPHIYRKQYKGCDFKASSFHMTNVVEHFYHHRVREMGLGDICATCLETRSIVYNI